ncbi:hypothetical protein L798_14405 [Zootermopsis nevadensis]|uniref:Uncharacterized protein n=1 Tax=Zootermopsis nevadensis TaxID=136037 RepID=A0A067QYC8_ZOONE|nr:hypothetical protein L798_14405 [Zootermopsis nevadensis]
MYYLSQRLLRIFNLLTKKIVRIKNEPRYLVLRYDKCLELSASSPDVSADIGRRGRAFLPQRQHQSNDARPCFRGRGFKPTRRANSKTQVSFVCSRSSARVPEKIRFEPGSIK